MEEKKHEKVYKDFLREYIYSDEYGVLLLNGRWGSGKTHFLKQVVKKAHKDIKVRIIDYWDEDIEKKQVFFALSKTFSYLLSPHQILANNFIHYIKCNNLFN